MDLKLLLNKLLTGIVFAYAKKTSNDACFWYFYQPVEPDVIKALRR